MSLLPNCREMSRLLSEARDSGRRLGAHERLHLWVCGHCRRFLAQLGLLGAAAARAPETGPPLSDAAKERLRRALRG